MIKDKWVLFGTGRMLLFFRGILRCADIKPIYYIDNNEKKWNTFIDGIKVLPPADLTLDDCNILIACNAREEIKMQLINMGISDERIFVYEDFLKYYIGKKSGVISHSHAFGKLWSIVVDAYNGVGYGGMELWSYQVAEELLKRNQETIVYGSYGQVKAKQWEDEILRFPIYNELSDRYLDPIDKMVSDMLGRLPVLVINNWSECVLLAALIIKRIYPDKVRILTVVHMDNQILYKRIQNFYETMDVIICVSSRIRDTLKDSYSVPEYKLSVHGNFVRYKTLDIDNVRDEGTCINIGWGGRLDVSAKRADLLPTLIERLEKEMISYQLNIAGDGEYRDQLREYVDKTNVSDRVHILGQLPLCKMEDFWKKQNIFISLSDYEGASLALIEAMSQGAVPIVTDVSGVRDVIRSNTNGIIIPCRGIEAMVEAISVLYNNEEMRRNMSRAGQKLISERYTFDSYMDDLYRIIEEVKK